MKEYKNRQDRPLINPAFTAYYSISGEIITITPFMNTFALEIGLHYEIYNTLEQAEKRARFLASLPNLVGVIDV